MRNYYYLYDGKRYFWKYYTKEELDQALKFMRWTLIRKL